MKPKVTVYVTAAELAQLKKAAARQHSSISRYAKHRLILDEDAESNRGEVENSSAIAAAAAQRLAESVRKPLTIQMDGLVENLRTVIVMLDQLVKSTLIHLPEIPPAQHKERLAAGERRHRIWQQEVENLLRQLREANTERRQSAGNGAHA